MSPLVILVLLALFGGSAECAKKSSGSAAVPVKAAPAPPPVEDTSIIEEVTAKQLERLLHDKDYVAVYWCKCEIIAGSCDPCGLSGCVVLAGRRTVRSVVSPNG